MILSPFKKNIAGIWKIYRRDHVEERRLACPVRPDESNDFLRKEEQIHLEENRKPSEALADLIQR